MYTVFYAGLPRKPKKENKQNGDSSLAMAMKSGTRKRTNASQFGFDSFGRLPPHLRMSRDYLPMLDFPENLQQLEAASADWKTFEDWQIVMVCTRRRINLWYACR